MEEENKHNCIDCVNWNGWECTGECITCVDQDNFKPKNNESP